ncbi:MAG TPA: pantetheine-phosphate adenylyltransferase [Gammaproteobacteria bacterium]|nr:pantetheine-phosphate adenylyltransferase [Gammaproteobacteria bacterium]
MKLIAVYPGTFDPITNGHLDIANRASLMFTRLIVGIAASEKKNPLFPLEKRVAMAEEVLAHLPNVEVKPFRGLLVNNMQQWDSTVIVRGLRAISDFEYEVQLAEVNKQLDARLETIFIAASNKYTFLSSSIVRDIAGNAGDVSDFVQPCVSNAFAERFS